MKRFGFSKLRKIKKLKYQNKILKKLYKKEHELVVEKSLEIKELNDSITWWNNRFKAVEKENERLKSELELYENGVYFSSENDKLEIENEKLKEQLEYLKSNEYLKQVKWERDLNERLVNEYKNAMEKAIEYINSKTTFTIKGLDLNICDSEIEKLIAILENEEEEYES